MVVVVVVVHTPKGSWSAADSVEWQKMEGEKEGEFGELPPTVWCSESVEREGQGEAAVQNAMNSEEEAEQLERRRTAGFRSWQWG